MEVVLEEIKVTPALVAQQILAVAAVVGLMVLQGSKTSEQVVELVVIDLLCLEKVLAVVHLPNQRLL